MACSHVIAKTVGGYDYEFVDPVPDDYTCPICTLVQRDAHQVTCCGKIYCKSCLEQLEIYNHIIHNHYTQSIKCPNCRSKCCLAEEYKVFPDRNTISKINHLRIHCTNKERGCKWVGHLKDLDTVHRPKCPNEIVECTNKKQSGKPCGTKMQRCDLTVHKTQLCQWRKVKCRLCNEEGHHEKITGCHLEECPNLELPCGNNGCLVKTKRWLMTQHHDECPKQIVACQYRIVGCEKKFTRESTQDHSKEFKQHHLDKAMVQLANTGTQLHKTETRLDKTETRLNITEIQLNETKTRMDETLVQLRKTERRLDKAVSCIADLQSTGKSSVVIKIPITSKVSISSGFYVAKGGYYLDHGGYYLALRVDALGRQSAYSLAMAVMSGRHDDALEWPVKGTVTIELLNQKEDRNHKQVVDRKKVELGNKVVAPATHGKWIHLGDFTIEMPKEKTNYVERNNLFFKVEAYLNAPPKRWLL